MLNSVNLERLQTFVVAARSTTFAEAARQRGVSVSAVSQQVRALEGELGQALFERVGRRVRLTSEGRGLLDVAAVHLGAIADAVATLGARRSAVEGVVTIGSPRTFGQWWLTPRLPPLLEAAPGLRLELRFDVPTVLERALVDGGHDLVILARPPELPSVDATILAQEEFLAVTRHPPRGALDEAAARRLRWIVFAKDRPMHDAWWRACFGRASRPNVEPVVEAPALEVMLALATRGVGAVVLPDYFVEPALERCEVHRLPVVAKRPARSSLFLAWRKNTVRTARLEAVRHALLAAR